MATWRLLPVLKNKFETAFPSETLGPHVTHILPLRLGRQCFKNAQRNFSQAGAEPISIRSTSIENRK